MISVYITSFNKEKFLSRAIESVLNQSLKPQEIIIIDDSSTDNSVELIKGFKSRYPSIIKTIFNEQNQGISRTRNLALKKCNEELITYLDGDDVFYKNKLQNEYDCFLKNKNANVVYSNFNYIDHDDNPVQLFADLNDKPVTGNIFKQTFTREYNVSSGNNYIYEMFYKSNFIDAGMYDEKIKIWEDWDLRIRMSKISEYDYCPIINSAYRKLDEGLHNSNVELHYREQLKIHKKNKHLLNDIEKSERTLIRNKIYSRLKNLLTVVLKKKIEEGKHINVMKIVFSFILTFRLRKAISFIIREISFLKPKPY